MVEEIRQEVATEGYIRAPIDPEKLQIKQDNLINGIVKYGRLRAISKEQVGAGTKTVYTVPDQYSAFICSVNLSMSTTSNVGNRNASVSFTSQPNDFFMFLEASNTVGPGNESITTSFPIPVKINSSDGISVFITGANTNSWVSMVLYEVSNSVLSNFV